MKKKKALQAIKEIHSYQELIKSGNNLENASIQNIDFSTLNVKWESFELKNAVFLGCSLSHDDQISIIKKGGIIFPEFPDLIYNPYRSSLYNWQELYHKHSSNSTIDFEIYEHFLESKYDPSMVEALSQRIHDNSIDDALRDYLKPDAQGNYNIKSIGIMGGHSTLRTDPYFFEVARTAQLLTQNGYLVLSGGGPGTMEAANLGAYFSNYDQDDLIQAINILKESTNYKKVSYHEKALEVLSKYPNGAESLAIPTWFYGHEPSNVFGSHIAKYFSNSIREDTLLAVCIHGILFAPGSAGTTQEIFMDAAQNHYTTFDYVSPMIFMGKKRYTEDTQLYQTIQQLSKGKAYGELLQLVDTAEEALEAFKKNPPYRAKNNT